VCEAFVSRLRVPAMATLSALPVALARPISSNRACVVCSSPCSRFRRGRNCPGQRASSACTARISVAGVRLIGVHHRQQAHAGHALGADALLLAGLDARHQHARLPQLSSSHTVL
jgi:hypothetical protein